MTGAPLPYIPDVVQEPLYRAEAWGLELSDDVLQARDYIQWFTAINYRRRGSLFN